MEKDEFFLKRIRELANLSWQRDIVTFSDFLNLNEQNIVSSLKHQFPQIVMETSGGYENAERQMVAFLPDALYYEWQFPIAYLEIVPSYPKFAEKFTTGFLLLPRLVVRRITPFAPFTPYTAVAEASFNTEID